MLHANPPAPNERRARLAELLGIALPSERAVAAHVITQEEHPHYWLEKLLLDLNDSELVPAYFVKPKSGAPFPAILYNHAHGGNYELGKDELLLGRPALQAPTFADALTRAGYAVLCIDHWLFGERRGRTESALFKEMLWRGRVLWGMMVYDNLRALDYLTSRADVDANRIATLGISMGGTMAWWCAALDERLRVCIDLCSLTDYDALIATDGLDGHGIYYYVPGLLNEFASWEINALIAPRPHLGLAGKSDPLTPRAGLERIDTELRRVYQSLNAPEAWRLQIYPGGHFETAHMRASVLAFLKQWL
jgi:dienelactone hydrolase